jgi:hypothetical protein
MALLLEQAHGTGLVDEAKYNADQLKDMLAKGHAMKNDAGQASYPIGDEADLRKAIKAVGRGGGSHDAIRRHIIKRAKALGKSDLIPDNWSSSGSNTSKESADDAGTAPHTEVVTETGALLEEGTAKSGRLKIQIITPGWGSSGYYSADVLEAAATDKVFPAGTHMYFDHPTEAESAERPGRSVKDLAAVLLEDATWNGGALVASAKPGGLGKAVFVKEDEDFVKALGVSIRASAEVSEGEADGRRGVIVDRLVEGKSIDFVTAAGRGGKVLDVLESARAVAEATANDAREALQKLVSVAYNESGADGETKAWAYVRDYDPDAKVVYFDLSADGKYGTFQQSYESNAAGPSALTGDRSEVRARTEYVAVAASTEEAAEGGEQGASDQSTGHPDGAGSPPDAPDTPAGAPADTDPEPTTTDPAAPDAADPAAQAAETTPPASQEETMTENQGAGGAAPLSSVRQIIDAELSESRRELAVVRARENARRILGEALRDQWVPPATVTRITEHLMASLPLTDKNELDETELVKRATRELGLAEQELAEALTAAGMGRPRDLGYQSTSQIGGLGGAELDRRLEESFKDLGLPESTAKIAAKGR